MYYDQSGTVVFPQMFCSTKCLDTNNKNGRAAIHLYQTGKLHNRNHYSNETNLPQKQSPISRPHIHYKSDDEIIVHIVYMPTPSNRMENTWLSDVMRTILLTSHYCNSNPNLLR